MSAESAKKPSDGKQGRGAVAAGLAVLAGIIIVWWVAPHACPFRYAIGGPSVPFSPCIPNLKQIDGAKEQWALEHKKAVGDPVVISEVAQLLKKGEWPECPKGGPYEVGLVGESPVCRFPEHALYWLYPRWAPRDVKSRDPAVLRAICRNNLMAIDAAKRYWAERHSGWPGAVAPENAVFGPQVLRVVTSWFTVYIGPRRFEVRLFSIPRPTYYPIQKPECPSDGTYAIGVVGQLPTCSVPGHTL